MCNLSKKEDKFSQAIEQVCKETLEKGANHYKQKKSVAQTYSSKREWSMQESVYNIMSELRLRKVFPDVVNVISYLFEKRVRTSLTKEDLS